MMNTNGEMQKQLVINRPIPEQRTPESVTLFENFKGYAFDFFYFEEAIPLPFNPEANAWKALIQYRFTRENFDNGWTNLKVGGQ